MVDSRRLNGHLCVNGSYPAKWSSALSHPRTRSCSSPPLDTRQLPLRLHLGEHGPTPSLARSSRSGTRILHTIAYIFWATYLGNIQSTALYTLDSKPAIKHAVVNSRARRCAHLIAILVKLDYGSKWD